MKHLCNINWILSVLKPYTNTEDEVFLQYTLEHFYPKLGFKIKFFNALAKDISEAKVPWSHLYIFTGKF